MYHSNQLEHKITIYYLTEQDIEVEYGIRRDPLDGLEPIDKKTDVGKKKKKFQTYTKSGGRNLLKIKIMR